MYFGKIPHILGPKNFHSSKLFAWNVLAGKFLDSKAKISKIEDFTLYKHMGKELMLECRIISYHINPGFSFG